MGAPIVVVGDAIIDALVGFDGSVESVPGGAALNVAVGLSILGRAVAQVAAVGADPEGDVVRAHLAAHSVDLLASDTVGPTGVATSHRVDGEPVYAFNEPMLRRRPMPSAAAGESLAAAPAVVATAVPLDDAEQVAALVEAFTACKGLRVVDPNPRPALLHDVAAFRRGFEALAAVAHVVKVSDEDLALLYGEEVPVLDAPVALVTHGAGGATLLRGDDVLAAPAAPLTEPVVDTLGAGDAALAALVDGLLRVGVEAPLADLQGVLERAMAVAGATARRPGGLLRLP